MCVKGRGNSAMRSIISVLLVTWSLGALADLSPVRTVDSDDDVSGCVFVGQITRSNGLLQTKPVSKILGAALKEAADAGADTVIMRKSTHGGVVLDAYKCKSAAAKP